jgi:hypothetical protein
MHQVAFEPTIPVFERAKTVHVLDRAVTVIGTCPNYHTQITYPNYQIRYKYHFKHLCSPDRISEPVALYTIVSW